MAFVRPASETPRTLSRIFSPAPSKTDKNLKICAKNGKEIGVCDRLLIPTPLQMSHFFLKILLLLSSVARCRIAIDSHGRRRNHELRNPQIFGEIWNKIKWTILEFSKLCEVMKSVSDLLSDITFLDKSSL